MTFSARTVLKRLAAAADRVLPPPAGVVVLIYHRVGGRSASEVDLDPAAFDAQLAHLAEHHRCSRSTPRWKGWRAGSRSRVWCSRSTTEPPTSPTSWCPRSHWLLDRLDA